MQALSRLGYGDLLQMRQSKGWRATTSAHAVMVIAAAALLAGCVSSPPQKTASKQRSKEYFAESEYGVKASPRVSTKRSGLPRGGGRDQIGKPYVVKGKVYVPKEEKNYTKVGAASWYGDAFHGRLTANGEVYDMTHLTAAHPTMPLPSYARVTNVKNGSSVIVRVNDRGPFAHNRVIDLSRRAAELLDYAHAGVAQVKVEYVGRAPLHGEDDQYLVASYRPGSNAVPLPGDGLPSGVMIAMAGTTPSSASVAASAAFPGVLSQGGAAAAQVELPDLGPMIPERPADAQLARRASTALLSYADPRQSLATAAFAAFDRTTSAGWKDGAGATPFIAVGTFGARGEAESIAAKLAGTGNVAVVASGSAFVVTIAVPAGGAELDAALRTAWAVGASDAMIVRD